MAIPLYWGIAIFHMWKKILTKHIVIWITANALPITKNKLFANPCAWKSFNATPHLNGYNSLTFSKLNISIIICDAKLIAKYGIKSCQTIPIDAVSKTNAKLECINERCGCCFPKAQIAINKIAPIAILA